MKKGFTLIELLAVIIILAIIALIAVPTILDIINKSKTKATEISGKNYIRGINNCIMSEKLEDDTKDVSNLNSLCKNYIKGNLPTGGNVTIKNGEVTDYVLDFDGDLTGPDGKIKTYNVGDLLYYNPVTGEKSCTGYTESNSLNENNTGCMKWYVIKDNGSTVDVILDHNTAEGVAWNKTGGNWDEPAIASARLASDVSGWSSQAKKSARMITAGEVWEITKSTNGVSDLETGGLTEGFYFNSNTSDGQGYAWLFDYTRGCIESGCNKEDSENSKYWTSTPGGSSGWSVTSSGRLHVCYAECSDTSGIRPVITISK